MNCCVLLLTVYADLPLFFEGIRVTREPYTFLAYQGTLDLLKHGGDNLLAVVPKLIIPIKVGLNTRNSNTICNMMKVLQVLVECDDYIGQALVPYYRQILPIFNLVVLLNNNKKSKSKNRNFTSTINKKIDLRDVVYQTLEILQRTGGQHAYANIKYMVPTHN